MVLTAKRFIEQGAGAVTVYHEPQPTDYNNANIAWDMHQQIGEDMKALAPEMDHAAATLIDEIASGRLKAVMLLMGEFNRTPKINGTNGRDHWPRVFSVAMAGGGVKEGYIHGASDALGGEPDRAVGVARR